jgi:peptidoglycan/LPS O-acetylase OafA/YrhL
LEAQAPITDVNDSIVARPALPRLRLEYLDGVRGAASFYVMLTHLALFINPALFTEVKWLTPATAWMRYGRTSVSIFIVLSGYCLMLPVARTAGSTITGGLWPYLARRARRIMPPYYAALLISLILTWIFSTQINRIGTFWSTMIPINSKVVISHLLLIHNFSNDWISKIDAPMWSVATEWQIYFLFPLVLLPIYRLSTAGMLASVLLIGVAPMFLFHTGETAAPWFTLLFALGMVGAAINFTDSGRWRALRERMSWSAACIVATAGVAIWHTLVAPRLHLKWKGDLIEDVITGLATMSLLIACTNNLHTESRSAVVKCLESKPLLFLGAISYSLYLMHAPILGVADIAIRAIAASAAISALMYIVGGAAATVIVTYLFYLVFERPFTTRKANSPV